MFTIIVLLALLAAVGVGMYFVVTAMNPTVRGQVRINRWADRKERRELEHARRVTELEAKAARRTRSARSTTAG